MMMRDLTKLLIRPIITEKSTRLQESNKYSFEVTLGANRGSVKQAVEKLFDVKVLKVNVMRTQRKGRRFGPRWVPGREIKKAIVTLKPGDTITVFEGV